MGYYVVDEDLGKLIRISKTIALANFITVFEAPNIKRLKEHLSFVEQISADTPLEDIEENKEITAIVAENVQVSCTPKNIIQKEGESFFLHSEISSDCSVYNWVFRDFVGQFEIISG